MCAPKNIDLTIAERYIGLISQNNLANILNVSQRFINSLHQPMKPHGLVVKFPNRQKGNKKAYYSIDDFIHQLKGELVNLFQQDEPERSLVGKKDMTMTIICSSRITPQRTSTIQSGALST